MGNRIRGSKKREKVRVEGDLLSSDSLRDNAKHVASSLEELQIELVDASSTMNCQDNLMVLNKVVYELIERFKVLEKNCFPASFNRAKTA